MPSQGVFPSRLQDVYSVVENETTISACLGNWNWWVALPLFIVALLCDLINSAPASGHFAIISWNTVVTTLKIYNDSDVNGTSRVVHPANHKKQPLSK